MSYDIDFCHPATQEPLVIDEVHFLRDDAPPAQAGGRRSRMASLSITYNYSKHFYRVLGEDGIRSLYGKSGSETIPRLEAAIGQLDGEPDEEAWKSTEGNAKRALERLLSLAKARPDGVWLGN